MTNTLENKAKFFALYWGQKVLRCITQNKVAGNGLSGLMYIDINSETLKSNWYLELTPISQISDEDLNYVCKIIGEERSNPFSEVGRRNTRSYLHGRMMPSIEIFKSIQAVDYLRSRGYALSWMDLSVETLVEYGWVKLKGGSDD